MLLSCRVGESTATAPLRCCSGCHRDEIPMLLWHLWLLPECFNLYSTWPALFPSFSLSPPSTEEELTPWGDAAPRSTQDPTQLQQHPLPHTLSRHWSKASCCRRQAGAAAGKGENVIFQFPSDILSGGEQRGFLTAESKAELTGSNIPRSLMLVWVESVNLCLQK